ncbi:hypothetical protein GPECTOR_289g773 [Gonium pectorale]|uniref:Uncharacterized protein n=1 Tax=Gonium pectorale TaxID=33097 RepID=A0A150FVY2_GONPE|nr:hypothetical protein GPECTOR_289g773 [Gonium pectorale]|eukprot:KXZ41771.1 hypothetical protein GPECTOR_289g773 [Gonium pectorale]
MEAPARERWSSRVWPQLLPELAERIVDCLDGNEIAATFRGVNKATAEHFSGPQHTTIRLSEPVPAHAFAAHWLAPGATRGLTFYMRCELVRLTARSGVLANLEVALQAAGFLEAVAEAFGAAAGVGHLAMCQWLWDYSRNLIEVRLTPDWAAKVEWLEAQGCPRSSGAAAEAAGLAEHGEALARLTWLRERGYPVDGDAVSAAASAGNTAAMQYLVPEAPVLTAGGLGDVVLHVIHGGHLAALQTLHSANWPLHQNARRYAVLAARNGHLHVLAWLLDTLGPETVVLNGKLFTAAAWSGSVELLAWLRQRGCPCHRNAYLAAAGSGCVAALEQLAEQGCPIRGNGQPYIEACRSGDMATQGCPVDYEALENSAEKWCDEATPSWIPWVRALLEEHPSHLQP